MITEDYVSFETAKLLKEKGFDNVTCQNSPHFAYNKDGQFSGPSWDTQYNAPTLQMAMKWLREKHNIHITMAIENNGNYIGYLYRTTGANIQGWDRRLSKTSYEEACEAAIKYCLENLI